jgi:hypothetical protein
MPASCYLIALNPDGRLQLCYPGESSVAPSASREIEYPQDPSAGFGLTDGVGLQAFVLVASRSRLPSFDDWRRALGELPWKTTDSDGVWQFDGRRFETTLQRGSVRPLADLPRPLEAACRKLGSFSGIEAIQAVAFPIKTAKQMKERSN